MQAHIISSIVMDIAAFQVSHRVGKDIDTTALRAARQGQSPMGRWNVTRGFDLQESRWNVTCMGSIWRENSLRTATTHRKQ